eukprot:1160510-Pelagomonas_calceolata.AAC.4
MHTHARTSSHVGMTWREAREERRNAEWARPLRLTQALHPQLQTPGSIRRFTAMVAEGRKGSE